MQALDRMGIAHVDWQNDAQSALKAMLARPVHLVISDFNMPGMDGLAFLQAVRSQKATQRAGFIMVTGSADPTLLARGQRLGLNNYLKKPFTPEELRTSIERVVGRL